MIVGHRDSRIHCGLFILGMILLFASSIRADQHAGTVAPNRITIGTLEARKPAILERVAGLVVFKAPDHDQWWTGANGVLIKAGVSWERGGTVWECAKYRLQGWSLKLIHPLDRGHVVVDIGEGGVHLRDGGKWSETRESLPWDKADGFRQIFPLNKDVSHAVRSVMKPDGTYSLFIDDKMVVTALIKSPRPLSLTEDFVGNGVPRILEVGQAGAMIDNAYQRSSVAAGLSFSPGQFKGEVEKIQKNGTSSRDPDVEGTPLYNVDVVCWRNLRSEHVSDLPSRRSHVFVAHISPSINPPFAQRWEPVQQFPRLRSTRHEMICDSDKSGLDE